MLKVGLFIFLFAQPMLLQAEVAAVTNATSGSLAQPVRVEQQMGYQQQSFPDWPQRGQSTREVIPPPPPGPYMSKALSDFSDKAKTFDRNLDKPVKSINPSNITMDTFSPDRSWPEDQNNYRTNGFSQRWMPESGYQYPKSQYIDRSYPSSATARLPVDSNYRSRSAPVMNIPGMNTSGSRWLPSMSADSGRMIPMRPYSASPYYYYGSGYNRMPYPVVGNQ